MSKNEIRMLERRKDPEYRRRENEKRNERRREEYRKEKEARLRNIPSPSLLPHYTNEVEQESSVPTKNYIVHKKVELVEVTTFVHENCPLKTRKMNQIVFFTARTMETSAVRGPPNHKFNIF